MSIPWRSPHDIYRVTVATSTNQTMPFLTHDQHVVPPQKIVILRHAIFPQFWPCWWSAQFFPYSAIFAQLLPNCPLDGRDRPVTANATTAYCFSLSKWLKYCEWAWRTALIMLHVTGTVVGLPCSRMTSLTTLKACMVASLSDILSLVRTAVLTEKPRSPTAFPFPFPEMVLLTAGMYPMYR